MIDGLSVLVGLFIGWASMWAFDYWFFGQRMRSDAAELRTLREQQGAHEAERDDLASRLTHAETQLEETGDELVTRRADAKEASSRADKLAEELTTTRNNLNVAKNEIDDLRAQLKVANIRAGAPATAPDVADGEAAVGSVQVETPATPPKKDNLKLINGIGPVYEKRLNAAGIMNFAQLHAQDPKRVHAIINPKNWQQVDPESWVEEAGLFASQPLLQSDVLVKVKGIGPKYAQMLRAGGIESLEALAESSAEAVEKIIGDELAVGADPADWVAQAQKLIS